MKTVGGRRVQIAGVYVLLILAFGALAFVVAVPLSYQVSFLLLEVIAGQLNFVLQGQRLLPVIIALQAGLALVVPQLAAWLPIWQGTRISVQDALSGNRPTPSTHKPTEKVTPTDATQPPPTVHRSPFTVLFSPHPRVPASPPPRVSPRRLSRPLLIAFRNIFRRKGRLVLTLFTLTLGGAVFIATFNVQVSMGKYIDQIGQYFLSDVNVSLDRPYRTAEIETLLAEVPGVGRVEGWAGARAELIQEDGSAGERVNLLAPPADSPLVEPVLIAGRWVVPGDENAIVLSEVFLSQFPDLKVGDPFLLQVNGDETEWVVVGFLPVCRKERGLFGLHQL